ncbi:excitatory amino acid transporter 3-like [Gigantopelta aegis]|uniref:excitatory amino acid transporter 3-like n=1 Tax=Gigantopelta aegis TaxID=1735272 RepID=UPI001B888C86|nr:excitatory amino acid transporter 3-like [Gigantopelta aegis]
MDSDTLPKGSPFITDISTENVPVIAPENVSFGRKVLRFLKKNALLICLVFSLFLGIAMGAGLRSLDPPLNKAEIGYLKFPGDLLMNMLKMLILPLIVSSLISGLTALDTRASGKMGAFAVIYYLTTTLAAVILGIILVASIQPGHRGGGSDDYARTGEAKIVKPADTFLDLLRQCFPDNLVESAFQKPVTKQFEVKPDPEESSNITTTMATTNETVKVEKQYESRTVKVPGMNVLGLVVFSIALGIILGKMGEKGKPLKDLFDCLCEATMKLVHIVIWYSPIGVMFLVAAKVVEMEDIERTFKQLLFYMITIMCGLIAHGFITLPIIYAVIVRKNPYKYLLGVLQALLTAIGTSSRLHGSLMDVARESLGVARLGSLQTPVRPIILPCDCCATLMRPMRTMRTVQQPYGNVQHLKKLARACDPSELHTTPLQPVRITNILPCDSRTPCTIW